MKLYYHPASTTSRIVMLCAAEEKIDLEYQVVDLFTGEHMKPPYADKNPSCLVPMIEDGDFRLTESSTIIKYLAEKAGSASWPKELRARAKVSEMMDWFNTNLYRDFAYGLRVSPGVPDAQAAERGGAGRDARMGQEKSKGWLKVLDRT
jgi:glutathione S-transferase